MVVLTSCEREHGDTDQSRHLSNSAAATMTAAVHSTPSYSDAGQVLVTNGGSIVCAANEAASALAAAGIAVQLGGNGDEVETTTITFPPALTQLANRVHQLVPAARMVKGAAARQVQLAIGPDGAVVGSLTLGAAAPTCDAAR
ncbi:hypothetical protein SAMN05444157_1393 [Frankineae bacterium MT45]|nr:hypothetical protein SAMN05444157_1393 [Frankineae bacterium MT45]